MCELHQTYLLNEYDYSKILEGSYSIYRETLRHSNTGQFIKKLDIKETKINSDEDNDVELIIVGVVVATVVVVSITFGVVNYIKRKKLEKLLKYTSQEEYNNRNFIELTNIHNKVNDEYFYYENNNKIYCV